MEGPASLGLVVSAAAPQGRPQATPRGCGQEPGVSVVGERLCFARCRHHAPAEGSTQTISAMYWAAAATITSAWKTSWNPNHRGHGSGRWRA